MFNYVFNFKFDKAKVFFICIKLAVCEYFCYCNVFCLLIICFYFFRIAVNDQIIEVDEKSLVGVTQAYAASVLRNTSGVVRWGNFLFFLEYYNFMFIVAGIII